jgi:hypothetical protein
MAFVYLGNWAAAVGLIVGVSQFLEAAVNPAVRRRLATQILAIPDERWTDVLPSANRKFLDVFDYLYAPRQWKGNSLLWTIVVSAFAGSLVAPLFRDGSWHAGPGHLSSIIPWAAMGFATLLMNGLFTRRKIRPRFIDGLASRLVSNYSGDRLQAEETLSGAVWSLVVSAAIAAGLLLIWLAVGAGFLLIVHSNYLAEGVPQGAGAKALLGIFLFFLIGFEMLALAGKYLRRISVTRAVLSSLCAVALVALFSFKTVSLGLPQLRTNLSEVFGFVLLNLVADSVSLAETRIVLEAGRSVSTGKLLLLLLLDVLLSAAIYLAIPSATGNLRSFLDAIAGRNHWVGIFFWATFLTSFLFYVFLASVVLLKLLRGFAVGYGWLGRILQVRKKPFHALGFIASGFVSMSFAFLAGVSVLVGGTNSARPAPERGSPIEERIRYFLADISLGERVLFYELHSDSSSQEAVRRWKAGVRVANVDRFKRSELRDSGWTIVYAGTNMRIDGSDVTLTTDHVSFDEERVRYILVDIRLGAPASYYDGDTSANSVEAVRRWKRHVRVVNYRRFERLNLPGRGCTITYKGTDTPIDGMDVKLSSD